MGSSAWLARMVAVCSVTALAGGALVVTPANADTRGTPALPVATPDTSAVRGDVVTTRGEAVLTCLRITIAGVSPGGRAFVTVTGPNQRSRAARVGKRYSKVIRRSRTLLVVPGVYRVTSRSVAVTGGTDVPKVATKKLRVRKNRCTGFTVRYQFVPAPTACETATVGATGPGGGKIFYVDMSRSVGSQCFEAAPDAWNGGDDPAAAWGCEVTPIPVAAATGIGTGEANTTAIVAGCNTPGIAAGLADTYAGGSQTDWFLPSQDELNQLCKYAYAYTSAGVAITGGQSVAPAQQAADCIITSPNILQSGFAAAYYWSSSQYNAIGAWSQDFVNGRQGFDNKVSSFPVRPVRAF